MVLDHPGYLGLTSLGVIAIHADWPAYPAEHGPDVALTTLANFPERTTFRPIDDIDRCVLFVASPEPDDPYAESGFHVALWHDDVLALGDLGRIDGVVAATHQAWEGHRRDKLRAELGEAPDGGDPLDHLYVEGPNGKFIAIELQGLHTYADDERDYPHFPHDTISVTRAGWDHLDAALARRLKIPPALQPRLLPLLEAQLYDTAVREMAVALEMELRKATETSSFGLQLVERYIEELAGTGRYIPAYLKLLRFELRAAFKFVRNEFAHNLLELSPARGYALLSRLSEMYGVIGMLASGDS